jgi:signal peptidase II
MSSPSERTNQVAARLMPLILTLVVIVVDQITKAVIVALVPRIESGTIVPVFGDFLRIIHTRNLGVAFSIGRSLPETARRLLFILLPVAVLVGVGFYYFRSDEFTRLQRWAVAGIIGGGIGNLIDRVFRADGVVDFVDVRFYGIFGMERWPTFNVADATVVVCGILLIAGLLFQKPIEATTISEEGSEQEN